jgi:hypothetical protein
MSAECDNRRAWASPEPYIHAYAMTLDNLARRHVRIRRPLHHSLLPVILGVLIRDCTCRLASRRRAHHFDELSDPPLRRPQLSPWPDVFDVKCLDYETRNRRSIKGSAGGRDRL